MLTTMMKIYEANFPRSAGTSTASRGRHCSSAVGRQGLRAKLHYTDTGYEHQLRTPATNTTNEHHQRTKICHIPTSSHVEILGCGIAMWQICCRIVVRGTLNLREWTIQEWTYRHGVAKVDNAGVDNSAPCGRGGQCRSGLIGTMWQGWTMREWTKQESSSK